MGFIGKIIGFFIGYRWGGFFGGLAGVFIGHLLDKKLSEIAIVRSSIFEKRPTRQRLFMETTFAVLGHLAKSKGRVTTDDIQLATRLMNEMGLDDNNRKLAQQAFNLGKAADFPIRQVIREFRESCGQRRDLLRAFVEVQFHAALLDGHLEQAELSILNTIAEELGIAQAQFDSMLAMYLAAQQFAQGGFSQYQYRSYQKNNYQRGSQQQYQQARYDTGPTLEDAYKVLGVSASDDQNTVKRAYRRLMNEHHPDKLVAKGLPEEMMNIAKEKAQQIQAAYDLIRRAKGWK